MVQAVHDVEVVQVADVAVHVGLRVARQKNRVHEHESGPIGRAELHPGRLPSALRGDAEEPSGSRKRIGVTTKIEGPPVVAPAEQQILPFVAGHVSRLAPGHGVAPDAEVLVDGNPGAVRRDCEGPHEGALRGHGPRRRVGGPLHEEPIRTARLVSPDQQGRAIGEPRGGDRLHRAKGNGLWLPRAGRDLDQPRRRAGLQEEHPCAAG